MIKHKYTAMLLLALLPLFASAQEQQPEMAEAMRSNGKIYVVVAVCLTILIGLFLYMASVDRRLRKLEKTN